jgi:HPt (histidine-containing phosphotransfer) domain-containing protein
LPAFPGGGEDKPGGMDQPSPPPRSVSPPSPPSWDRNLALARLDRDEALLDEMIGLFLAEAPAQVAALLDAQARADLHSLAEIAHAIKGMAGHFAAETVIAQAMELEQSARAQPAADYSQLAQALANATIDLAAELGKSRKV